MGEGEREQEERGGEEGEGGCQIVEVVSRDLFPPLMSVSEGGSGRGSGREGGGGRERGSWSDSETDLSLVAERIVEEVLGTEGEGCGTKQGRRGERGGGREGAKTEKGERVRRKIRGGGSRSNRDGRGNREGSDNATKDKGNIKAHNLVPGTDGGEERERRRRRGGMKRGGKGSPTEGREKSVRFLLRDRRNSDHQAREGSIESDRVREMGGMSREREEREEERVREQEEEGVRRERVKGDIRQSEVMQDGSKVTLCTNGTRKVVSADGRSVTLHFFNGDIKHIQPDKSVVSRGPGTCSALAVLYFDALTLSVYNRCNLHAF